MAGNVRRGAIVKTLIIATDLQVQHLSVSVREDTLMLLFVNKVQGFYTRFRIKYFISITFVNQRISYENMKTDGTLNIDSNFFFYDFDIVVMMTVK